MSVSARNNDWFDWILIKKYQGVTIVGWKKNRSNRQVAAFWRFFFKLTKYKDE